MENNQGLRKVLNKISLPGLLILLMITIIMVVTVFMLPGNNPDEWQNSETHDPTTSLIRKKSFLKAGLALAESDSIGILADLGDSTLYLQLKGVTLYAAKITRYKYDRYFLGINDSLYQALFSAPLNIDGQKASVEKEPVIVRNAPKDSIEASKFVFVPDTNQSEPVRISLLLDKNIRLVLREDKPFREQPGSVKQYYRIAKIARKIFGRDEEHVPAIEVQVAGSEAVAMYRALPFKAQVVVRM